MASRFRFRLLAWLLPLGFFFTSCAAPLASAGVFRGEGQAFIVAGNVTDARQLARDIALQQAVQRALETQLRGDAKALRMVQLRAQELTPVAAKLATDKRIVNEQRNGNFLRLTVEIEIPDAAIKRVLTQTSVGTQAASKKNAANHPSVMVILSEEISGRSNPEPFALVSVIRQLRKAGFRVLDESALRNSIAHDRAVQSVLRGDAQAARAAALQFGAAMVITGRASAQESAMRGGGMQVYGANITLRAYQADSAAVLASSSSDGNYPHINALTGQQKALDIAADKATTALLMQLEKGFEQTGDVVAVSVSGVSYYQLSILKKILQRDFPEIIQLQQRGYAADVARLDISVDKPQHFADKVVQRDFGGFRLDIVSFSPHKIDFVLITSRQ